MNDLLWNSLMQIFGVSTKYIKQILCHSFIYFIRHLNILVHWHLFYITWLRCNSEDESPKKNFSDVFNSVSDSRRNAIRQNLPKWKERRVGGRRTAVPDIIVVVIIIRVIRVIGSFQPLLFVFPPVLHLVLTRKVLFPHLHPPKSPFMIRQSNAMQSKVGG